MTRWAEHRHDHHGDGLTTFCLDGRRAARLGGVRLWLSLLLHRHGSDILRVKGLLHVQGVDRPVVVQGVQHLVHKPLHLDAWPEGRPRRASWSSAATSTGQRSSGRSSAFCRVGRPAMAASASTR